MKRTVHTRFRCVEHPLERFFGIIPLETAPRLVRANLVTQEGGGGQGCQTPGFRAKPRKPRNVNPVNPVKIVSKLFYWVSWVYEFPLNPVNPVNPVKKV